MRDAFEVLDLPRNATADEIKQRYRELAKQYHPDKHINNPLADLAAEKFKEIQAAYETLTKGRKHEQGSYRASGSRSGPHSSSSGPNSSDYESLMDEVSTFLERRQWAQAIERCDRLIRIAPDSWEAHAMKGEALHELKQFSASVVNLEKASQLNPDLPPASLWTLALDHIELGHYYKAIPIIQRVMAHTGEMPNVIAHLAYCFELTDKSKAAPLWRKLEQIDPNNNLLQQHKQAQIQQPASSKSDDLCCVCALIACIFECL